MLLLAKIHLDNISERLHLLRTSPYSAQWFHIYAPYVYIFTLMLTLTPSHRYRLNNQSIRQTIKAHSKELTDPLTGIKWKELRMKSLVSYTIVRIREQKVMKQSSSHHPHHRHHHHHHHHQHHHQRSTTHHISLLVKLKHETHIDAAIQLRHTDESSPHGWIPHAMKVGWRHRHVTTGLYTDTQTHVVN